MQCFVSDDIHVSIISIYIHINEYVVTVVKSSEEPPIHSPSILKYKNPSFSPCYSRTFLFSREATNFPRHGHRRLLFRCSHSGRNVPSRDIPGHERSRITYISPDDLSACQNSDHRVRAEQFAHRNDNPHAGQKDGGRLLIVRILSAADVAEKTDFLGENHGISKRWKLLDRVFQKYSSPFIIPNDGCTITRGGERRGRGLFSNLPIILKLQKPDVFIKSFT